MKKISTLLVLLTLQLSAFSTTNIQYLNGDFEGSTFLDTQSGIKETVTLEHYQTWEYGDLYAFADFVHAKDKLQFSDIKNDFYGEIAPRISINKMMNLNPFNGFVKEYYTAFQYNRGDHYHGWLYGMGVDLNIPLFNVFGVNLYRKIQNIGDNTYQLSINYHASLADRWHVEGFCDWTTRDFLTQNQLLFNLAPTFGITSNKLEVGTEWHYYHENITHHDNDVFQAMIKLSF